MTLNCVDIVIFSLYILGQFTVYVSSGPYATFENNISYTPLEDMLKSIKEERPDVFIMVIF